MPIITPLDFEEEIRKINCQASKLPPITKRNGYENLCRTEDKLRFFQPQNDERELEEKARKMMRKIPTRKKKRRPRKRNLLR